MKPLYALYIEGGDPWSLTNIPAVFTYNKAQLDDLAARINKHNKGAASVQQIEIHASSLDHMTIASIYSEYSLNKGKTK